MSLCAQHCPSQFCKHKFTELLVLPSDPLLRGFFGFSSAPPERDVSSTLTVQLHVSTACSVPEPAEGPVLPARAQPPPQCWGGACPCVGFTSLLPNCVLLSNHPDRV